MPRELPPGWKEEFSRHRDGFVASMRDAVADSSEVKSCILDNEGRRQKFSRWTSEGMVYWDKGSLEDAEGFLIYLINQGHKVAYAITRTEKSSEIFVTYDQDQMDWTPVWPSDLRIDIVRISEPMVA